MTGDDELITIKEVGTVDGLLTEVQRHEKEARSSNFSGTLRFEIQLKRGIVQLIRQSAESTGLPPGRGDSR